MTTSKRHLVRFERLLCEIFSEMGSCTCFHEETERSSRTDLTVVSEPTGQTYRFEVKIRERVTPQVADDLFARFQNEPLPAEVIRIVYAPVISRRVAEIARRHGISYMDSGGSCHILSPANGLFISREGEERMRASEPSPADPFSRKSSRIVRAMLHEPERGWQVSELAEHPDVDVSAGLVSKVKDALIRENYAVLRDRLLYLKEPVDLLRAWSEKYPGPSGEYQFYVRGDTSRIETTVADWCKGKGIQHALARFSSAWRLAPEVRYTVASLYVGPEALRARVLESLRADCEAKEVESGANLLLLSPYDESVFVGSESTPELVTSPLQTYLDLKSLAGRGEEAAEAVFQKHLRKGLEAAGAEKGGA